MTSGTMSAIGTAMKSATPPDDVVGDKVKVGDSVGDRVGFVGLSSV